MPHLFIGNVSKQIHMFAYRSLERPGIVTQPIPIGGQIRVSPMGSDKELTTPEIDYVIEQHTRYGMVKVEELDSNRHPFNGLCYSIGKPISVEKLRKAMKKAEDSLNVLGKQMRKEAALAVSSQIENQIGAPLKNFEMSFAEEEPRGGYTDDTDHLAEGVRVTREELPNVEGRRR